MQGEPVQKIEYQLGHGSLRINLTFRKMFDEKVQGNYEAKEIPDFDDLKVLPDPELVA